MPPRLLGIGVDVYSKFECSCWVIAALATLLVCGVVVAQDYSSGIPMVGMQQPTAAGGDIAIRDGLADFDNGDCATCEITLPATIESGDRVFIVLAIDGGQTSDSCTCKAGETCAAETFSSVGVTTKVGDVTIAVWEKDAVAGDEDSDIVECVNGATDQTSAFSFAISGASGAGAGWAGQTGYSSVPISTATSPAPAANDLVFRVTAVDQVDVPVKPSGHSDVDVVSQGSMTGISIGVAVDDDAGDSGSASWSISGDKGWAAGSFYVPD
jgi:hypothetical protein